MKRKFLLVFTAFLILILGFYSYIIFDARASTLEIVKKAKLRIVEPIFTQNISELQLKELLLVQDPNFYRHNGTDFSGHTITTITQSLVKHLYFENFQPGLAKIKQSVIAMYALDPLISKDEQLHLFLNITYFGEIAGRKVIGFGQAAKSYFGKTISELSSDEYFQLLAMLSGPNLYNVKANPDKNIEQVVLLRKKLGFKAPASSSEKRSGLE